MGTSLNFDQVWIENRFRKRKRMSGTKLHVDQQTGFMTSSESWGFTAEGKKTFLARFRVCDSLASVARSIPIHIQTVYDHIALDPKFREEFVKANQIQGKAKKLNKALVDVAEEEKRDFISSLLKKAGNRLGK